jgi:hypothetical protein
VGDELLLVDGRATLSFWSVAGRRRAAGRRSGGIETAAPAGRRSGSQVASRLLVDGRAAGPASRRPGSVKAAGGRAMSRQLVGG